jgi:hypothetical protein
MTVRPIDEVTCNMVNNQCQIQHFQVPKKILQGITPYLDKTRISECPWASTQTPSSDGCNFGETDRWSDLQHGEQSMSDTAFSGAKKILQGITPYLDRIRISEWPWASTQTPSSDGRDRWSDLQHGEQAMLDTAFSGNQKKFCKGLPPTLIKFKFLNASGPIFNCLQANPEQWCSELHQQQ